MLALAMSRALLSKWLHAQQCASSHSWQQSTLKQFYTIMMHVCVKWQTCCKTCFTEAQVVCGSSASCEPSVIQGRYARSSPPLPALLSGCLLKTWMVPSLASFAGMPSCWANSSTPLMWTSSLLKSRSASTCDTSSLPWFTKLCYSAQMQLLNSASVQCMLSLHPARLASQVQLYEQVLAVCAAF